MADQVGPDVREGLSDAGRLLKLFVRSVQNDRVTFLAASIAFYAILSIFPMLLLVIVLGSLIGGEAFAETIVLQVSGFLTAEAQAVLEEALLDETGRGGASIIGLGFLLWSSLRVFRGLDIAFSQIYTDAPDPGFLVTIRNAILVFASIGIAIVALIVVRGYIHLFDFPIAVRYLSPVAIFITIAIVFYPMYFVFPNEPQPALAIVPGTLVAALGWTLLGELFSLYAAHAGTYALFGVIGGLLLLLVWFYFGAIIVLVGAVINAVIAGEYQPEEDIELLGPMRVSGKDQ